MAIEEMSSYPGNLAITLGGEYGGNGELPVAILHIDHSYQRPLSLQRVKQMAANWDPKIAGRLTVNMRDDGDVYVVDGQHRLEAHKMRGVAVAQCTVYFGWSKQQEAQAFHKLNSTQVKTSRYVNHHAGVEGGELVPSAIERVVNEFGFQTSDRANKIHQNKIAAISVLYKIYEHRYVGGTEGLRRVLHILTTAYPGRIQAHMMDGEMLIGVHSFLVRVRNDTKFREERLIGRLAVTPPTALLNRARGLMAAMGSSRFDVVMPDVIWKVYNDGLKGPQRLTPFTPTRAEEK